ncbi:MAG: hypothetical protein LQ341_007851, partial [Variospora aurantia]
MAPLIAASKTNPDELAIFGAAGGSRIITAVAQIALNVLQRNRSTYAAVQQARLHDQLIPNVLSMELDYDNGTVQAMRDKGHVVERVPPGHSSACVVRRRGDGAFEAVAEVRQRNSAGM